MDGDRSDLQEIHNIALRHNVITIVDDSHGDFIYDQVPEFGVALERRHLVDVYISSLSKALGCFGGYVAASEQIIELLINRSRSFMLLLWATFPSVFFCIGSYSNSDQG